MKIKDAVVGRRVRYTSYMDVGKEGYEEGVITSMNDTYVFVRYNGDIHSKATSPRHLEYVEEI